VITSGLHTVSAARRLGSGTSKPIPALALSMVAWLALMVLPSMGLAQSWFRRGDVDGDGEVGADRWDGQRLGEPGRDASGPSGGDRVQRRQRLQHHLPDRLRGSWGRTIRRRERYDPGAGADGSAGRDRAGSVHLGLGPADAGWSDSIGCGGGNPGSARPRPDILNRRSRGFSPPGGKCGLIRPTSLPVSPIISSFRPAPNHQPQRKEPCFSTAVF